jgi:hypothetical protein
MTAEPIFKSVFGDSWQSLPTVMYKHYANRPFCSDKYVCNGKMNVKASWLFRLLAPFSHILGGIPITNQENIPVQVIFQSEPDTNNLHFIRTFMMRNKSPYIFHSIMVPAGENNITEVMKFGLCWRSKFSWDGKKVNLAHCGYSVHLFKKFIPLPLTWLIGHIHAEEEAINQDTFKMFVEIHHWLFGQTYEYNGEFTMEAADG